MKKNLFAIETQAELNSLIHRPQDDCAGDCEWCAKFHKAVSTINTGTAAMTLTINEDEPLVRYYPFQVWCEVCSDGENAEFYDACDWAEHHAKRRHSA